MGRKSCTDWCESPEAKDRRIDAMLREMVVENGLEFMAVGHEPKPLTIQEIADFVGVGFTSLQRIEQQALNNLRKKMLNLGG
jgi:hypothetical protein